jgi:hypothetical protein
MTGPMPLRDDAGHHHNRVFEPNKLRLARPLAADLRRPWERPAPPGRLTPARVRRGFRNIRAKAAQPAGAPKPGPGRPPGSKNRRPSIRHDVGKTTKREHTLKARHERAG